jgi:hypothetical protein
MHSVIYDIRTCLNSRRSSSHDAVIVRLKDYSQEQFKALRFTSQITWEQEA